MQYSNYYCNCNNFDCVICSFTSKAWCLSQFWHITMTHFFPTSPFNYCHYYYYYSLCEILIMKIIILFHQLKMNIEIYFIMCKLCIVQVGGADWLHTIRGTQCVCACCGMPDWLSACRRTSLHLIVSPENYIRSFVWMLSTARKPFAGGTCVYPIPKFGSTAGITIPTQGSFYHLKTYFFDYYKCAV